MIIIISPKDIENHYQNVEGSGVDIDYHYRLRTWKIFFPQKFSTIFGNYQSLRTAKGTIKV